MAATKSIIAAVVTRFNDDTTGLNSAVGGRLYYGQAPADVSWPYIVLTLVDSGIHETFVETLERCLLQFNIYADDADEAVDIFDKLKAVYDRAKLDFSGTSDDWATVYMRRVRANLLPDEWTGQRQTWVHSSDYEVLADPA